MLGKSKADGESGAEKSSWLRPLGGSTPAPKSERWKDWAVGHRSW